MIQRPKVIHVDEKEYESFLINNFFRAATPVPPEGTAEQPDGPAPGDRAT